MYPARRPHRRVASVVVLTALAVGSAAGCGAPSTGSSEPVAEPAPAVSIPAEAKIDGRTYAPSRSGSPDDDAAKAKVAEAAKTCADLQEAWAATNRALVDLSPGHPRSLVASFRDAQRAVTSVEPPSDVDAAWSTMAAYLGDVVEAFETVDTDDADAVTSAMTQAISAGDTTRATQAAQDVTAYLASTCGTS